MASYSARILADTPAGYWKLDDATAVTAADSSGGGNPGTYQRTTQLTVLQAAAGTDTGTSVLFNGGGTGGYISVPDAAALRLSGDLSLEAWFKSSSSATQVLVSKFTNGGSFPGYGLRLTGPIGFWLGDVWQATPTNYNNGVWHHVVATLSGSTGTIYIDGVPVSTASRTPSLITAQALTIATDPSLAQSFVGNLDEVAVYDYALSATQVLAHYYSSMTGSPPARVSQDAVVVVTTANPSGRVSQDVVVVVGVGTPANRVSQVGILTVEQGAPKARVSQEGVLTVDQGTPLARISQVGMLLVEQTNPMRVSQTGALVVTQGQPKVRASQVGALTVWAGSPKARVSQTGVLVVYSTVAPPSTTSPAALLMTL